MCSRLIYAITIFFSIAGLLEGQSAPSGGAIASALAWYPLWQTGNRVVPGVQKCTGEVGTMQYTLRCEPLSVVLNGERDPAGKCSIDHIDAPVTPTDGEHLMGSLTNTANSPAMTLVPTRPLIAAPPITTFPSSILKGPQLQSCDELPKTEGPVTFRVMPKQQAISPELSRMAREMALKIRRALDPGCILHFPKVRIEDPFAHIYLECMATVTEVWEFTIIDGRVADFPRWQYATEKKDLPGGAESRLRNSEWWWGDSRSR